MIEYNDPDDLPGAPLDLGDPTMNAALARVFESGQLRRAFDALTARSKPEPHEDDGEQREH